MKRRQVLAWSAAWASASPAAPAAVVQCVVPAKAGGGFDLTCQLVQALLSTPGRQPHIVYQPGGIGALTYSELVRGQRPQPRELVAFSSGTLLNIAQGRFGPWRPDRVRWVASLAQDHGVVAVHQDAPWRSLQDLLTALKRDTAAVAFASGGTIGSQDWMKTALLARAAGVSHRALRVVAFEGGGDALRALEGRYVQVLCGDAAELDRHRAQGARVRLLASLSAQRLPGRWATVPTAVEQGVELRWPILRGVYTSADFPEPAWAELNRLLALPHTAQVLADQVRQHGLQPWLLTGAPLAAEVDAQLQHYRALAGLFGLVKQPGTADASSPSRG